MIALSILLTAYVILKAWDIALTLEGFRRGMDDINPMFKDKTSLFTLSFAIDLFAVGICFVVSMIDMTAAIILAAIACGWALIIDLRNADILRRKK